MIPVVLWAVWGWVCWAACLLWWAAGQLAAASKVVTVLALAGRAIGGACAACRGEVREKEEVKG